MKKLYLACPYSDPDPKVRNQRVRQASMVAGALMRRGYIVFSAITHTHEIAEYGGIDPMDREFWLTQDRTFVEWADEIVVLMIDGWDRSIGVRREIEWARELDKPVRYILGGGASSAS